jgi:inorganic pyrophosphatase
MTPYDHSARDPETGAVRVIIDTPAGSRNKYKFDEVLRLFRISRVLPHGMVFPHDFGSIPGTCAEDGDPLDALVLGLGATFPGCLVHVRLIGVLKAYQLERGKRIQNDRLLATAVTPVNDPAARSLQDLDPEHLRNLEEFFVSYNRAQGRKFHITGRGTPQTAQTLLKRAEQRFAAARLSRPTKSAS